MPTESGSAVDGLKEHAETVAENTAEQVEATIEATIETVEQALIVAEEKAEAAQEVANIVVEAVAHSEQQRQIDEKERDLWHALSEVKTDLETMTTRQSSLETSLQAAMETIALLTVASSPPQMEPSSSIPPNSEEISEALAEVTDPLTVQTPLSDVVESPAPARRLRRRL